MKEEAQVSSVFTQPWSRGSPEKSLHSEPTLLSKAVLLKPGFSILIFITWCSHCPLKHGSVNKKGPPYPSFKSPTVLGLFVGMLLIHLSPIWKLLCSSF